MNEAEKKMLWDLKIQTLEETRHFLCEYLEPSKFYSFFRSKGMLTKDDEELIDSHVTRKQRSHKFIDILISKGPKAFETLCDSITDEGTQMFVVRELNMNLERLINSKRRPAELPPQLDDDCLPGPMDNMANEKISTLYSSYVTQDDKSLQVSKDNISTESSCLGFNRCPTQAQDNNSLSDSRKNVQNSVVSDVDSNKTQNFNKNPLHPTYSISDA
jgi:hypothetical protein